MAREMPKRANSMTANSLRDRVEIQGLLILATVFLQVLSLHSFTLGDSSSNWLGLVGYSVGALMYYLFGMGSYAICAFCSWIGFRLLLNKDMANVKQKTRWFTIMLLSGSILLNLLEDCSPKVGLWLSDVLHSPSAPKDIQLHLGGNPLFYLYTDLPEINLKRILNTLGIVVVFFTAFTAGFLGLTQLNLEPMVTFLKNLWPKRKLELWRRAKLYLFRKKDTPVKPEKSVLKKPFVREVEVEREPWLPPINLPKEPPLRQENPLPQPSKRELALQAQRVYNGDFKEYDLPALEFLTEAKVVDQTSLQLDLRRQAEILEDTLLSFGIEGRVGQINCGPTITSFEVHPAVGVKVQKIKALENDIALNMEARSIRIIAPIPGKAAVGIEVPNPKPQEVGFKDIIDFYQNSKNKSRIPILLGKAVNGDYVISDLAKMPHCIIAGATGSGKSVCINTIVMSIVYNARPDEIKLLMVDPKKVELTPYSNLPHMLAPVITEPAGACTALLWLVKEMESRYDLLKLTGVRNIEGFNSRTIDPDFEASLDREVPEKMHYIVAIIDELADLMMVSSHDIETPIARIAQMARAVGIHLVLATQRPSREVITGLIKANFPTRISFKVASRVNSQIILDEAGAESLLGNGDMLFLPPGSSSLVRAQGAFIRDEDIRKVVESICDQAPPNYAIQSFDRPSPMDDLLGEEADSDKVDSLYSQARELVVKTQNASTTFLQRKLKIGYARAASLIDQLEDNEIVSPPEGSKGRRVLVIPKEIAESAAEEASD